MVRPDRDAFLELARQQLARGEDRARAIPLVREVLADLDTPLATFCKVDDGATSFLFESAEGEEHRGRFSFIGIGARARFVARAGRVEIRRGDDVQRIDLAEDHREDPLDHLRGLIDALRPVEIPGLPRFSGGAVGYVSYDWVRYVERLPETSPDNLGVPDCWFTVPETVLVHDRYHQSLSVIRAVEIDGVADPGKAYDRALEEIDSLVAKLAEPVPSRLAAMPEPPAADVHVPEPSSNTPRERYLEVVKRCKEYIQAGDIFQVVPSQRFSLPLDADPFPIYRQLRVLNPSPYLFFLRCDDHVVLGSSPEILVRLEDGTIELRPIAGTMPRGATPPEDREIERKLLADPKELAEHVMLVDLGRNDVGRVAEIGSVVVDEFQVIERYSHVMHIVSNVRATLRPGLDAIDLLRATFPAGTLTGAPKVRAMEIIEEMEPDRRGLYGGCVGYFDYHGNMDMCIAIRTLLAKDGMVHVQAGGGVVADSDPQAEWEESRHKANAPLRAIRLASGRH